LIVAGAVALACLIAAPAASAAAPQLLVHGSNIYSIDANSRALVWRAETRPTASSPSCSAVIRQRRWRGSPAAVLFRCNSRQDEFPGDMAMGASTVAFSRVYVEGQGCCDTELRTILRTTGRAGLGSSFHYIGCGGDDIRGMAAHGNTAVYGRLVWTTTNCPGNPSTGTETLTGGGVSTLNLSSGAARPLAGTPPAAFLGVSSTRLVLVPYDLTNPPVNALPGSLPEIQVWNLGTRSQERTIPETGQVVALAVRGDEIAVMVDDAGSVRIDRFSASTGAAEGSDPVPSTARPMLALYYRWAVYVAGKTVSALDTETGRVHVVARPTYAPAQLRAARGQAVWLAHGDRILAAPLP
jgi:hypothetical protein